MRHPPRLRFVFRIAPAAVAAAAAAVGAAPVLAETSAVNREDKNVTLLAEPAGLTAIPGGEFAYTAGLRGGYFLDSRTVLELAGSSGKFSYRERSRQYDATTIELKRFVGNSFYVHAGGGYTRLHRRGAPPAWIFGYEKEKNFAFEVKQLSTTFGLGNQWQWRGFTLGCDWANVLFPTATLAVNDVTDADSQVEDDRRAREKRRTEREARNPAGRFAQLYLGASF